MEIFKTLIWTPYQGKIKYITISQVLGKIQQSAAGLTNAHYIDVTQKALQYLNAYYPRDKLLYLLNEFKILKNQNG
jgi:hypothetical protein